MANLKLWAQGVFDLILHAEQHYLVRGDFDKCIALIGFDNSIEVSISTYLSLHPIHRRGVKYKKKDCDEWLKNFNSKIDFYYQEVKNRKIEEICDKGTILYCHQHRNDQYHAGRKGVPDSRTLDNARRAAIWIFSVLFDEPNAEIILQEEVSNLYPEKNNQKPSDSENKIIDARYGLFQIGSQLYYASELLYSHDPVAYRELAIELKENPLREMDE